MLRELVSCIEGLLVSRAAQPVADELIVVWIEIALDRSVAEERRVDRSVLV